MIPRSRSKKYHHFHRTLFLPLYTGLMPVFGKASIKMIHPFLYY